MNVKSYLNCAEKWMPRVIESLAEYREAMDVLKTLQQADPQDLDDAMRMYADLVTQLTISYRVTKLDELHKNQAPDARVVTALREFQPLEDRELFERTGITPKRWTDVLAGHPLERLEIAILCQVFKVDPSLFMYSLKHDYVHGTRLKLVESGFLTPSLVHLKTKTKRPLPESYLTIYWDEEEFGSVELKRTAPAWKYHIHAYIASHEDDLLKEVFPDLIEKVAADE